MIQMFIINNATISYYDTLFIMIRTYFGLFIILIAIIIKNVFRINCL